MACREESEKSDFTRTNDDARLYDYHTCTTVYQFTKCLCCYSYRCYIVTFTVTVTTVVVTTVIVTVTVTVSYSYRLLQLLFVKVLLVHCLFPKTPESSSA
jgi:hypothetical protein